MIGAGMLCAAGWSPLRLAAQRGGMFLGSADDAAIAYSTAPVNNVVEDLNRQLQDGSAGLTFQGRSGYLQSAIESLKLPIDSQLLVFSKTSLQGRLVNPSSPRALFFNDRVVLAWVRDGDLLEAAAHDEKAGVVFYSLEQRPAERPMFKREFRCLGCHMTGDTLGVPGMLMFSTTSDTGDRPMKMVTTDQRSPLAERWGGWFVTGDSGAARHRGNQVPALEGHPGGGVASVAGLFDPDGFRGTSSDIAALLTFSHQTQMINLLTRASWEARAAEVGTRVRVRGLVTAPSGLLATGSAVVQDATGGILVRLGDEAGSLALGQLVELDGTRSTKAGMLSLRVTRPAMVLGSQGDPDPLRRATGALGESEEALLVIARGLVSSAVSKLGGGGISFTIDDGSGALRVTISAGAAIAATSVQRGAWLELRGVLGQETTGKEPLRGYRLWPRTAADLRVIATPGSAAGAVCCTSADHPTGQVATGAASQAALAPSSVPGRQPVLSRPHPTTQPAGVTAGINPATGPVAKPPRGAGLVVSGMGLAAMAALLAWFTRRRGPDGLPDQGGVGAPAVEAEPSDGLPRLSLLRAEVGDPPEERRILPPT